MRNFYFSLSIICSLLSWQAYGHETSCVNASQLWKWAEGREQKITASAQCGGTYFEDDSDKPDLLTSLSRNLQTFNDQARSQFRPNCVLPETYGPSLHSPNAQPLLHFEAINTEQIFSNAVDPAATKNLLPASTVKVESIEAKYVSESSPHSSAIGGAETAQKLIAECAKLVFEAKNKSDPLFASKKSFAEVENQIRLRAPKNPAKGSLVNDAFGFSFVRHKLSEAQSRQIIKLLNQANSCSLFELKDGHGNTQLSNCEQFRGKKLKNYRRQELARIALAVAIGAAGNYFRGGEVLPTGNDQITRMINALATASIRPLVTGEPVNPNQFAWDLARSDFAQTSYETHGYVAGATGKNGFGKTVLSGAEMNALYFGLTCGNVGCSFLGIPVGLIYAGFGQAADRNYSIFGKPANAYSEAITGGLMGLALGLYYASEHEHTISSRLLTLDLARISSQDLCLDVSDVLK